LKRFLKVHFWSLSEKYLEPFDGIFLPERQQIRRRNIFMVLHCDYFKLLLIPNHSSRPHCLLLHSYQSGAVFPGVSHVDVEKLEKSGKPLGDVRPDSIELNNVS